MSTNVVSFRFPVESLLEGQPEGVVRAHRITTNNIVSLSRQLATLQAQVNASKTAATAAASSSTVIEEQQSVTGVTAFNGLTGAVIFFPSLGFVNDQSAVVAYKTEQSDDGAMLLLDDASAIAVTLNAGVAAPWYCWMVNYGAGTATLTPSAGTISYFGNPGAASMPLLSNQAAYIAFDGTNFWAIVLPVPPQSIAEVAHEWLDSYDAATGLFTQSQPAFSDVSGQIAEAQLPSAGLTTTITTAALTPTGMQGSMTFTNGILTASTPAT